MRNTEIVEAFFAAFTAQDAAAARALMAPDFVFTSPQDDHLDTEAYFATCFPTADHIVSRSFVRLVDTGGGAVFALYRFTTPTGEAFRNAEFITVHEGLIASVEVYFGAKQNADPEPIADPDLGQPTR